LRRITDGLDALAIDGDRGIALSAGAELDVKGVDARVGVVLKELLNYIRRQEQPWQLNYGPPCSSSDTMIFWENNNLY
jgi:hypothetical protein